jgi:transposase
MMKETLKHQKAFDYYYALGETRSCAEVARKFCVSKTSVQKWSKAFEWQGRVQKRDAANAKKIINTTDESIVNVKTDYREQISKSLNAIQQLIDSIYDEEGNLTLTLKNCSDLKRSIDIFTQLVTLDLQLADDTQQATSNSRVLNEEQLKQLSVETLREIRKHVLIVQKLMNSTEQHK